MDVFLRDLRCGLRMLLKRKGFTLVVVLTLALATGTTTTLFSIVSKVLITPLAFEAPETIAFVWSRNEGLSRVRAPLTFTEYDDLRRKQQSFADVAALAGTVQTLTGATDPAYVDGYRVSASFFPLLGVEMCLGRTFHADVRRPRIASRAYRPHRDASARLRSGVDLGICRFRPSGLRT